MLYLLDTANTELIKRAYDLYPIEGVTTNPTIISREMRSFLAILTDIRKIIGHDSMLHVQTMSTVAEKIVAEAEYLNQTIGGNLYIKIPVIPQGIKAIKLLKAKGMNITATAIFTPEQALMAAVAGADFVAPYVNRLDNICANGADVVGDIVRLFDVYGLKAKVLAASFKTVQQVHEVALRGAHAATINPDTMDALLTHPLTDSSVSQFINDWEGVYGKGKVTYDVK